MTATPLSRTPSAPWLVLLLATLVAALPGVSRAAEPVAGIDYVEIADGKRLGPADGKIEVVEVFGYWCHHCADFEPMMERWKQQQGKDVRVSFLPLPRNPDDMLAVAYFAADSIHALARTHAATFKGIHDSRELPANPTLDELTAFYAGLGVDKNRFRAAASAPATLARIEPARDFALAMGVEGTPTLIVNGRYRVLGRTLEDNLRIASALVERERAAGR
ncbi:thiol:disulfide interchange protein DsbA/DsbL [Marilutibacter spongiae]|uniref:Thiol:disulfide interchange protein DsbA/DsbL n=1 Tax=Marilutibacter spongiae TaxID=2025720 RepID=A0A7W3TN22_9GAMM|nr:thiol:disulfide interchange protein DsbA/DsbL [Lysobacter spongiae]MBB1061361.1 thiol:disulfide interchange protein DsbA/DsbL [Lysobacter spongiae]